MKVIGISGSPTKDSNTDTLIKALLGATGAQTEFVKLSAIKVGPCIACRVDGKCPPRRRDGDSRKHNG